MWIIRQLQNDPDPDPTGKSDKYHQTIGRHEEVGIIATVRGHLCWLMAKLVAQNKPDYYGEILAIIKNYVTDQNLYIRKQATVPLTQLVARRTATKNSDGSVFNWNTNEREIVKILPFEMLRENAKTPRVLESLLYTFNAMKDLNETEAEEVLRTFLAWNEDYILRNLAALIVYFALFRDMNFPSNGSFHRQRFMDILVDQIKSGAAPMKSSLAWHFWNIIHHKLLPYENIRKSLPLFFSGEFDPGVASMFSSILDELLEAAPEDATSIYRQMIWALKDEIKADPERATALWIGGIEKIIPLLARDPDMLLSSVNDVREIWMAGAYVGDLKTIFESYRLVTATEKPRIRAAMKSIFEEMKKVKPTLPAVDWSL